MSEEQKEYEANQLANLIHQLQKMSEIIIQYYLWPFLPVFGILLAPLAVL